MLQVVSSISDGTIQAYDTSWVTARNAPTNAQAWDNSGAESDAMTARLYSGKYYIRRSFLFFDLSALPPGSWIIAVAVSVLGYLNATSNILLLQGTQHDPIQNADWSAYTGLGFSMIPWTQKLVDQVNTNDMYLNAAGRAYVRASAGSTARFCLMEYDHDAMNAAPVDNTPFNGMFFANHATPAYRPLITIAYKL